jgi:hypothetical protein
LCCTTTKFNLFKHYFYQVVVFCTRTCVRMPSDGVLFLLLVYVHNTLWEFEPQWGLGTQSVKGVVLFMKEKGEKVARNKQGEMPYHQ